MFADHDPPPAALRGLWTDGGECEVRGARCEARAVWALSEVVAFGRKVLERVFATAGMLSADNNSRGEIVTPNFHPLRRCLRDRRPRAASTAPSSCPRTRPPVGAAHPGFKYNRFPSLIVRTAGPADVVEAVVRAPPRHPFGTQRRPLIAGYTVTTARWSSTCRTKGDDRPGAPDGAGAGRCGARPGDPAHETGWR
jgi:hypothetical protein